MSGGCERHDDVYETCLVCEIDTLRAELRIRETSQIPVIPRGAQARMEALQAEVVSLREATREALVHLGRVGSSEPFSAQEYRQLGVKARNILREALAAGSRVEDGRDAACVERWPECESGSYDPRCCRFPKSCSCESGSRVEDA
jgi:hypothetical protein